MENFNIESKDEKEKPELGNFELDKNKGLILRKDRPMGEIIKNEADYENNPERKKAIEDLERTWVTEWTNMRTDNFSINIGKELEKPGWFDSFIEDKINNNSKKEVKKIFEKELIESEKVKTWLRKGIELYTNNLLDFDTEDIKLNEKLREKLKLYILKIQQGMEQIEEIEKKLQEKLKELRN